MSVSGSNETLNSKHMKRASGIISQTGVLLFPASSMWQTQTNSKHMKTIIFILMMTVAGLSVKAQKNEALYVVTSTDTIFFKKLVVKTNQAVGELPNGGKIKLAVDSIQRYSIKGRIRQRLPVNGRDGKTALMELVDFKNHIGVYKYECYNGVRDCTDAYFFYYRNNHCLNYHCNPNHKQVVAFLKGEVSENSYNDLANLK
jgi:hypothetical protein